MASDSDRARFTGLSAFPLTPFSADVLDEAALARILSVVERAAVDSITVLGSTGSGPYVGRVERQRVLTIAAEHAAGTPVIAGIGALRAADSVRNAKDAAETGAAGLLLAPLTYQPLGDDEVYGLFADVANATALPIVLYDNPGTTRFSFSDGLIARIARIPSVAAIKVPPLPPDSAAAAARLAELRALVPPGVAIGVSGDAAALGGLLAGADAWFSVIGGTLPGVATGIVRAVERGDADEAQRLADTLRPLWGLNAEFGSLRVTAAVAEELGLASPGCLPKPLLGLPQAARERVRAFVAGLDGGPSL